MEKKDSIDFETCSPSVFYDYIVQGGEGASEALYYLIKKRLSLVLGHLYKLHGVGIQDEFEDTIDDFFLYLHDGNSSFEARPFAMLGNVREKKAFFSWLISTYRIFLLNKQRNEARSPFSKKGTETDGLADEMPPDETITSILATSIAYADQQLQSRNRFIFYRLILSLLDHSLAIPQEAMAKALDMHPVTYRVCTKRQKDRFLRYIVDQEQGATLDLDEPHRLMRDHIIRCFDQLYELLMEQYDRALTELPRTDAVLLLRQHYSDGHESMMHESGPVYGIREAALIVHSLKEERMGGHRLSS